MSQTQRALDLAREAGFDLAGVAPCAPPPDAERFDRWLAKGYHAGLEYLRRDRDRILDPRKVFAPGRSILVVGLAHSRPSFSLADGARVARYAAGRDYHNVVGKQLKRLARTLQDEGLIGDRRRAVDAAPVLERSHAARAGVGFPSKAANLLHPEFGPWFFLGELIVDVELEPTEDPPPGSCGTCRACLDACPTEAIRSPGVVDANRCISYHTIENPGSIPRELRSKFGEWIFGCDVCSEVCPWGRTAPDLSSRFGTHAPLERTSLIELVDSSRGAALDFVGSPLSRPGRVGRARNAAIALGNRASDDGRRALLSALSFDPSAIVREAAGWALGRAHGSDGAVRDSLAAAARSERDVATANELRVTLDELA